MILAATALGAGFSVESAYTSSFGPDAWGTVHLQAADGPFEVGALVIGGTRQGLLGTTARSLDLAEGIRVRGELQLGMLRQIRSALPEEGLVGGPTGGLSVGLEADTGPVVTVLESGGIWDVGGYALGGVDAPVSDRFAFQPRLRWGTWAGDRDPALRVGLGLSYTAASGWFGALEASAGGRDVVHMGPGFVFTIGRR